jgi:hypothetical protein
MANTLSPVQNTFSQHFDAMVPLVMAEWPQLIEENLLATEGDLDLAVAYISGETDRTQTLIRRQIKELASLVEPEDKAAIAPELEDKAPIAPKDDASPPSNIENLLDDLESRTEHLIQELKAEMLPELEQRARSNLGQSLLIALGIGFVLGLILGGKRD